MKRMLLVLFMIASSKTILTETKTLMEELTHFLAANGLKRISIVAQDHSKDPLIPNLYSKLSAQFFTRIVPTRSGHKEVSQQDFFVFTPKLIIGDLSAVINIVHKTKVTHFEIVHTILACKICKYYSNL